MIELLGFSRAEGGFGARNHLFVVPSVVCATRVAEQVAARSDAVTLVHQHGCGHIGDDVSRAEDAFVGVAANANVGAAVVISLGCETVQGRRVASRLAECRSRVELVGIQAAGGTTRAAAAAGFAAEALRQELAIDRRSAAPFDGLTLGLAVSRPSTQVKALVARARSAGARVLIAQEDTVDVASRGATCVGFGRRPSSSLATVSSPGTGAQLHVSLAAGGAQVIVAFPAEEQPTMGFPICPVIGVASTSRLHGALRSEFDLGPDAGSAELWQTVLHVYNGEQCKAEARGSCEFALPRLRRTM